MDLPSVAIGSGTFGGVAVAGLVFWLGFDGGSFSIPSWTSFAIVVWWAIVIGIVLGIWPRQRIKAPARWTIGLLTTFVGLIGLSGFWASGAEQPFQAFDRGLLYVGVAVLACVACPRGSNSRCSDGVAVGLVAIAVLALVSRFFPGTVSSGSFLSFLPDAYTRLSYPVNYWNGLAILVALACPLLLRPAVSARSFRVRGLALAPFPAIAATVYLASSRTGAVTVIAGLGLFLALTGRRWMAAGAIALSLGASVVTIAVLSRLHTLVNGPFNTSAATSQGRQAAVAILLISAITAGSYGLLCRRLAGFEPSRRAGQIAVAGLAATLLAAFAASHPVARWRSFTEPPAKLTQGAYIQSHFLSTNSNWRWQFWKSAIDEFRTRPLIGRGAGAFEAWWAEHGRAVGFVGNAHSLYFQTLGDFGVIGLALLLGAFGTGAVVAIRRTRAAPRELREGAAAVTAGFIAYTLAAGVDWIWDLPVVSITGLVLVGLAVGPATEPNPEPPPHVPVQLSLSRRRVQARLRRERRHLRQRRLIRFTMAIFGALALSAQIDLYAADAKISASQSAIARGNFAEAIKLAGQARALEPWAATPKLQIALAEERRGRLLVARHWIEEAIASERNDWRLWLIAARIETKAGNIHLAEASLAHAQRLNPRSSIFTSIESAKP